MNTIAATILLLSGIWASGSACQEVQSPESIAGTMLRISVGLLAEKAGEEIADVFGTLHRLERLARVQGQGLRLRIDGADAEGLRGAVKAFGRILGYVADIRYDGSVGLSGQRLVRGLNVVWSTTIADGRLTFEADITGSMGEYLKRVRLRISCDERERPGSRIVGTATGHAFYGKCIGKRIFARRAPGEIRTGMHREVLGKIRTLGVGLFRGGDAELKALVEGLRNGVRQ